MSLTQCFSRKRVVKTGKKGADIDVTNTITRNYKPRSFSAYLRPTLPLDDFTRVMRGTL